jgi:sarcosine oxidase subunit gamma
MSGLVLILDGPRERRGFKGPRAPEWLAAHGIAVPPVPNSWTDSEAVLVARLGAAEFFLEDGPGATTLERLPAAAPGVYPLLREDWAFELRGAGVHDVLNQVCNVNFEALDPHSRTVIMTMMVGVAVLVVARIAADGRRYRIWCDPTFGPYLAGSLGEVVMDCGGGCTGGSF